MATEYGGTLLKAGEYLKVHEGRMDLTEMKAFLEEQEPLLVVDATHPYAAAVSENLFQACGQLELEYLRLIREQGSFDPEQVIEAASVDAAGRPPAARSFINIQRFRIMKKESLPACFPQERWRRPVKS